MGCVPFDDCVFSPLFCVLPGGIIYSSLGARNSHSCYRRAGGGADTESVVEPSRRPQTALASSEQQWWFDKSAA